MSLPDDISFEYRDLYIEKMVPILKALKNDFFEAARGADNNDLRNGLSMIIIGLRVMMKRNPDMFTQLIKVEDERILISEKMKNGQKELLREVAI